MSDKRRMLLLMVAYINHLLVCSSVCHSSSVDYLLGYLILPYRSSVTTTTTTGVGYAVGKWRPLLSEQIRHCGW